MEDRDIRRYEPLFGEWTVEKKLGQGSVGQVYEITKEQNGEILHSALKFICIPESQDDITRVLSLGTNENDLPEYYDRVMEDIIGEFRCMREMKDCDNIVRYEEHLVIPHKDGVGGDILMRMELLTPLMEYALDHELTEDDVISLGIDMANALDVCESHGIVHRDIKPDNIFVDDNGTFKLGDFGVARIIEETQMGLSHKGTIAYMAPEVYRGEEYSKTADIYSVGLVLYKYLNNGRLPFMPKYPETVDYEDSSKALIKRVRKDSIPAPSNGNEELKSIVMRACSAERRDRYQNAAEFKQALESVRDSSNSSRSCIQRLFKPLLSIAAVLIAFTGLTYGVWALIPKEVTDITGIDEEVFIHIGDAVEPPYVVKPSRFRDEPVTFRSEDKSVFTVDSNGKILALAVGESDMEMEARGFRKTAHITVIPKVTEIDGVEDLKLEEGKKAKLDPVLKPEKYSNEEIVYSSDNEKTVTVDKDGTVKAITDGIAGITISAGGATKEIKVIVEPKPEKTVTETQSQPENDNKGSSYNSSSKKAKKTSKKSSRKKKSGKSKKKSAAGYFDSGKDEYF